VPRIASQLAIDKLRVRFSVELSVDVKPSSGLHGRRNGGVVHMGIGPLAVGLGSIEVADS
jgi:hypothetical protein